MLRKIIGQSIVEYLTITILVMSAIMIGGPALVKSVNAYFAAMDSSAQDAGKETF